MNGTLITSTPKSSMHALACQGIMVASCYPQLRDMLRKKLGDDYVLLFAEPMPNSADNSIDWYTTQIVTVLNLENQDSLHEL